MLISGSDYVVRRKPQEVFFKNLSSKTKEIHILEGFYHDTLGEKDRHQAVIKARSFIKNAFNHPIETPNLITADQKGYTADESRALAKPEKNLFKQFYWWITKRIESCFKNLRRDQTRHGYRL